MTLVETCIDIFIVFDLMLKIRRSRIADVHVSEIVLVNFKDKRDLVFLYCLSPLFNNITCYCKGRLEHEC